MEQEIDILTPEQKQILAFFKSDDYLRGNYYFTGGTALSAFYLKHRYSDDLDFFTEIKTDSLTLNTIIQKWADTLKISFNSRQIDDSMF